MEIAALVHAYVMTDLSTTSEVKWNFLQGINSKKHSKTLYYEALSYELFS